MKILAKLTIGFLLISSVSSQAQNEMIEVGDQGEQIQPMNQLMPSSSLKTTSPGVTLNRGVPLDSLLSPQSMAVGGGIHGVGNGGDFVRSAFIQKGREIYNFLLNEPAGIQFAKDYFVNPYAFGTILNTRVILPVFEKPIDNQGQPVDAVWEAGSILLYVPTWEKFLTSHADVYIMIFHEMLRATGHSDDDFIISSRLKFSGGGGVYTPSGFISCSSCEKRTLTCIDTSTGENIVSRQMFARFHQCEKAKERIFNFYGQSYESSVRRLFVISGEAASGSNNSIGGTRVQIRFRAKDKSGFFGIICRGVKKTFVLPSGGKLGMGSYLSCESLKAAILNSSPESPVEVYYGNKGIKDYFFQF